MTEKVGLRSLFHNFVDNLHRPIYVRCVGWTANTVVHMESLGIHVLLGLRIA